MIVPKDKDQEADVLTTQEALALLRISRPTLYKLIQEGSLAPIPVSPALLRPKRLLFRRSDIERVLREGRRRP